MSLPIVLLGWLIYPALVLCSLLALAVVIERCWRLLPLRRQLPQSQGVALEAIAAGGAQRALGRLAEADDPMARVLRAGLEAAAEGSRQVQERAADAVEAEAAGLERGLGLLGTIAQVAPLLGLLGTVLGLMRAFAAAGSAERVTLALLADGIHQALGTTAAGLALAIPAWLAAGALGGIAQRLIDRLERAAAALPRLLAEGR